MVNNIWEHTNKSLSYYKFRNFENRVKVKTSPKILHTIIRPHIKCKNVCSKQRRTREILLYFYFIFFDGIKFYFQRKFQLFFTQNLIDKDQENKFDTIVMV